VNQNPEVSESAPAENGDQVGEIATLLLACMDAQDETTMGEIIMALVITRIMAGRVVATLYQMAEAHLGKEVVTKAATEVADHLTETHAGEDGKDLTADLLRLLASGKLGTFVRDWPADSAELPYIISHFLGFAHAAINQERPS